MIVLLTSRGRSLPWRTLKAAPAAVPMSGLIHRFDLWEVLSQSACQNVLQLSGQAQSVQRQILARVLSDRSVTRWRTCLSLTADSFEHDAPNRAAVFKRGSR
jgi:hypothetical protein